MDFHTLLRVESAKLHKDNKALEAELAKCQGNLQAISEDYIIEGQQLRDELDAEKAKAAKLWEGLKYLKTLQCDNPVFCGQGAICNSCWVRGWAKEQLAAELETVRRGERVETMRDDIDDIECQQCNWVGTTGDLEAPYSGIEPGCPVCQGTDFLEVIAAKLEAVTKEIE